MTTKIPTFDELMQPTLDALKHLGGSATINELLQQVLTMLALRPDVASQAHQGRPDMTEVEYRLHWARTYLKQYGMIDNPTRGHWELTPKGSAHPDIDAREVVRAYKRQPHPEKIQPGLLPGNDELDNEQNNAAAPMSDQQPNSLTPDLPTYTAVRHFMRSVDDVSYWLYRSMFNQIMEARGNPQEQADWADPDQWIPQLLQGEEQKLALRIWHESGKTLNPRYVRGAWYLATKHDLLERNGNGLLRCTAKGSAFLGELTGHVVVEIDGGEGLLVLLRMVAEKGPGKRGDFLSEFGAYCRTYTTFRAETVVKSALYDRLKNLVEREYITARGQSYQVTDGGLAYLDLSIGHSRATIAQRSKQSELLRLAKGLQAEARDQLVLYLSKMNPFKFEALVKLLLEEMGYDDVQTTSPTNDKGVDVVANIELGISSVREVIQVKRHKANINRTVLDQLRGSLHRFNAVRGTVITTGRFSKGTQEAAFERGAAPITLIDGDKLLDLLLEHQIGVTKKAVDYFEFDATKLMQFEIEPGEE